MKKRTTLYDTHQRLYEALILLADEDPSKPIAGAYELMKEVWYFINSDQATFNGKEIEKIKRPLYVNPVLIGKPEFNDFFEAELIYSSTLGGLALIEQDFIDEMSSWIEHKITNHQLAVTHKRKYTGFLEHLKTKNAPPQQNENPTQISFIANEYALAYIFDLNASGKHVPTNRSEGGYDAKQIKKDSSLFKSYNKTPDGFYRAVKRVLEFDLNTEQDLNHISMDWRNAVKKLSNNWLVTEQYLKDKGLIEE